MPSQGERTREGAGKQIAPTGRLSQALAGLVTPIAAFHEAVRLDVSKRPSRSQLVYGSQDEREQILSHTRELVQCTGKARRWAGEKSVDGGHHQVHRCAL